jgi:hypothetical protein
VPNSPLIDRVLAQFRRWPALVLEWSTYPPLLITLALAMAVAWGVGSAVGAPELLWHERWPIQLVAGLSLGALCAELGVVGYLLHARAVASAEMVKLAVELRSYVRRPCALFTISLLAAGLLARPRHEAPLRWPAMLGGCLAWAVVELLGWILGRKEVFPRWVEQFGTSLRRTKAPGSDRVAAGRVHLLQAALAAGLLAIYAAAYVVTWPAMMVVAVSLAIINALWGFIAYWFGPRRLAIFALVSLLPFVLGFIADSGIDGLAPTTTESVTAPAGLLDDDAALVAWRRKVPAAQPVLVVVAVSGGASRAGTWTVSVLTELEQRIPDFHRHVRLITGASGGMVGAAHYVSRLVEDGYDPAREKALLVERVARDSLTPLAEAWLLLGHDRGKALERAWQEATPELALPFASLRAGEAAGWRPSLVYSPMMVEDGRRLLASNLDLRALTESWGPLFDPQDKCPAGPERCRLATSAVQLFQLFPGSQATVSLAAVARMSATFPWVTTAVALPLRPARRVVDAGYYDNYGVDVAALWIARHASWLRANTGGVLLLQVRDERLSVERNRIDQDGPGWLARITSPMTAPLSAVLKARQATMSYRNDELVQLLAEVPAFSGDGFFRTAAFELPRQEPLSWYIPVAARERIAHSLGLDDDPATRQADPCTFEWNRVTFARLCAWWREHNVTAAGAPRCLPEPQLHCR